MAKSVTVMQRIKAGRTYPLIRVVFSRNGKPKIDPRATSFYLGTRWIGDLNLFAGEPDVMLSKPLEGIEPSVKFCRPLPYHLATAPFLNCTQQNLYFDFDHLEREFGPHDRKRAGKNRAKQFIRYARRNVTSDDDAWY